MDSGGLAMTALYAFVVLYCFNFDSQIVCEVSHNSLTQSPPKLYATEAECQDAANVRVQWGGSDTEWSRALCFRVAPTELTGQ